ncbi:hypothetical protein KIN20_036860 [Parelaphostrongylus tenuis]|uniref:Receptor ligand binding region domain-containing protein n=1 Tax=Parelaphostrongylus tenuis TaxID=148309 RepID=A0AAD5WLJ3_PARTN|nr:hypothetical protein KIN20_036860 [Parelaphostrongylus tenuis]
MSHFGWSEFAFVYSATEDRERCPVYHSDLQRALQVDEKHSLTFTTVIRNDTERDMKTALSQLRDRARMQQGK